MSEINRSEYVTRLTEAEITKQDNNKVLSVADLLGLDPNGEIARVFNESRNNINQIASQKENLLHCENNTLQLGKILGKDMEYINFQDQIQDELLAIA